METRVFSRSLKLMGNNFTISVVDHSEPEAKRFIDLAIAEIGRIESLLSTYRDTSQTMEINRSAGIKPLKVDREVFDLIQRSLAISRITQGAFDISYGGIDKKLWNFDRNMTALPDAETARAMTHLIDFRNIILDPILGTVFLKKKGMRIGFGGIGKGYAAQKARELLIEKGARAGIINAAGDLTTWGCQPDGKPWTVGIANPDLPQNAFSYLEISDMAVATSGTYEKYVFIGGKRYSHTIDPKTGLPVSGIKSVTVIHKNAEFADAMATPVAIMGIGPGLDMINQIPGMYCIVIDDQNKIYHSSNINIS